LAALKLYFFVSRFFIRIPSFLVNPLPDILARDESVYGVVVEDDRVAVGREGDVEFDASNQGENTRH
jgi:hypothetical protein